jgi:hypothetical protein
MEFTARWFISHFGDDCIDQWMIATSELKLPDTYREDEWYLMWYLLEHPEDINSDVHVIAVNGKRI